MQAMPQQTVVLGLGSNVGDSIALLRRAVEEIRRSIVPEAHVSGVYRSAALLPPGAPPEWDMPFYNMCVAGPCALSPGELLAACKQIETLLGRKDRGHWAPREIDVDILAYDTFVMASPELTIPHTALGMRAFALMPFDDVAPGWRHPVEGWTAYERLCAVDAGSLESLGPLEQL